MKDRLIAQVAEKAGLDPERAESAVDAVLAFLKEEPTAVKELVGGDHGVDLRERLGEAKEKIVPVAEKGKEALGEAKEKIAPVAEKGKEALGEAKEKIAPVAAKAKDRFRELIKRDKDGAAATPAASEGSEAAAATSGSPAEPATGETAPTDR